MQKIDAHQHFWKFDAERDAWITAEMELIRKDFLPEDLEPLLRQNGFEGSVIVQSDQSAFENVFQLSHADDHDFIKGVVGWVDLRADDIEHQLQALSVHEKLKGFRHVLQGEHPDFMLQPDFLRGLGTLAKYHFTYDLLLYPQHLDNFKSAYEATKYLIGEGYRKIAHVTHSAHLALAKERLEGYKKALQEANIPFNESYVKHCRHGIMLLAEIEERIKELLSLKQKPDSIVTVSDRLTNSTLSALKKAGLKVPDDMGLVGFSNSDIGHLLDPPLTCIRQPAFEMGQIATELLIQLIESKRLVTNFETRVLQGELVIRESARKKN